MTDSAAPRGSRPEPFAATGSGEPGGGDAPVEPGAAPRHARPAGDPADDGPPARRSSFLRETAIIVVSALVLSLLIKTFLVQAFFIPSESMEDTLLVGDRVMVSRLVPGAFDVHHGDIVVFKDPGGWLPPPAEQDDGPLAEGVRAALTFIGLLPQDTGEHLIKRVIGLPGDHVVCCDAEGRVSVNDEPLDEESYIKPGSIPSQDPFDRTVPADMLFVMGDNRQDSQDSRYNTGKPGGGYVPMGNVVGTAFVKVWPLSRFELLRNPGDVFADVPDAAP
ncbi:signal peptidase I [Cellulosimicrobium arenosum]|uniref:Signal peptidase I n=1 Tax=Cellulosimicrobium arenosum TaxID=2708133 RepID=A0A927G9R1_9MICO|nr:signal peptidase I [Cellulosimicrobium arenosum]